MVGSDPSHFFCCRRFESTEGSWKICTSAAPGRTTKVFATGSNGSSSGGRNPSQPGRLYEGFLCAQADVRRRRLLLSLFGHPRCPDRNPGQRPGRKGGNVDLDVANAATRRDKNVLLGVGGRLPTLIIRRSLHEVYLGFQLPCALLLPTTPLAVYHARRWSVVGADYFGMFSEEPGELLRGKATRNTGDIAGWRCRFTRWKARWTSGWGSWVRLVIRKYPGARFWRGIICAVRGPL